MNITSIKLLDVRLDFATIDCTTCDIQPCRGATRILQRGWGLKNGKFCDVVLMTYFMTSPKWRQIWYSWSFITL